MATMTIRIPDAKHERLRRLAELHGTSLNKLVEEWANVALAQHDAEARFRAMAARGNAKRAKVREGRGEHAGGDGLIGALLDQDELSR
jgi:predicted transcriptional regulator